MSNTYRRATAEDLANLPPLLIAFGPRPASEKVAPRDDDEPTIPLRRIRVTW